MASSQHFGDRLIGRMQATRSHLVVGLDPALDSLPPALLDGVDDLGGAARAAGAACRAIVDGVADLVPAVKPQSAFFEQLGSAGLAALEELIAHARAAGLIVIEDAKRADIGSTMTAYVAAALGRVSIGGRELPVHDSDALTVNPYLGSDTLEPALEVASRLGKGLFVLVRTSNPGAGELQELRVATDGTPRVFERVAAIVTRLGERRRGALGYADIGAVTGLTHPQDAPALRAALPWAPLLVPGLGAQGGRPRDFAAFLDEDGLGAIAAASRSIAAGWRQLPAEAPLKALREGARRATQATGAELRAGLEAAGRWPW